MNKGKIKYHTFGCKLNFAETSSIASLMEQAGFETLDDKDHDSTPDLIVINTCSVTELADKKCRQIIRSYAKRFPDAAILATGCYTQLKPDDVSRLPGVVAVVGNDRKERLVNYALDWTERHQAVHDVIESKLMRHFTPSCSRGNRTRYFLKIQDGCDYFCSYCTIPFARGRSRSATIAEIVDSARAVAVTGGKEIVITGVNIGDFGKPYGENFFDLIKELDKVEGIQRYRISSIEPNLLTDEMIDWVAQSRRFMPHFHLPLQAGSDTVLKLMRRHYTTSLFAERVGRIKRVMPHAFIGVDVIAGSRGETPALFQESVDFIESLDITRLHVFPYSERPGTRALEIKTVVNQQDKHERVKTLTALSDRKLSEFTNRFAGTSRKVLVEHSMHGETMYGFTDNYLKIALPADPELSNTIVDVELSGQVATENDCLTGEVL